MIIKVCGMREKQNVNDLHRLGIKMFGFIFYPDSSRFFYKNDQHNDISFLPEEVFKTGVFVNASPEQISLEIDRHSLTHIQLHGDEDPAICKLFKSRVSVIKAFRIHQGFSFTQTEPYSECDYFLFDASGEKYGGNGIQYDWGLLDAYQGKVPFLLSGGITPEDANRILLIDHPCFAGIDINSGFESAPGFKNKEKIQYFLNRLSCNTQ